jgi:DNA-binding NarL/FixJ family response regulator
MEQLKPIDILLADDHSLLRDALGSLIKSFERFRILADAGNGKEVIQIFSSGHQPDLVLLDLNMPIMDGYETAEYLYTHHPKVKILVLTMYDSEIALIRLLKFGVRGFLKKDIHPNELRRALEAVADDGYYYSHSATGKLGNLLQKSQNSQQSLDRIMLSDTEIELLRLASTDLTYKEVAMKMNLTPRAVDSLRDTLFEKLDVKSRVGLAIYAVKNGIVSI